MAIYDYVSGRRRGSVGGETYAINKGQNVVRAKAVQVANPKTRAQMRQRAIFANCNQFYKWSIQELFKFAFTDKKQTESDYNAFVRENVKRGYVNYPQTSRNLQKDICIGDWVMSKGNIFLDNNHIVADTISGFNNEVRVGFMAKTSYTSTTKPTIATVGELSQYCIQYMGVQNGDIITLVGIMWDANYSNAGGVQTLAARGHKTMKLGQFMVDTTSTETYNEWHDRTGGMCAFQVAKPAGETGSDVYYWQLIPGKDMAGESGAEFITNLMVSAAIIVSRPGATLKVSTSYLKHNIHAEAFLADARVEGLEDIVLNEWGATSEAILKGGLL